MKVHEGGSQCKCLFGGFEELSIKVTFLISTAERLTDQRIRRICRIRVMNEYSLCVCVFVCVFAVRVCASRVTARVGGVWQVGDGGVCGVVLLQ